MSLLELGRDPLAQLFHRIQNHAVDLEARDWSTWMRQRPQFASTDADHLGGLSCADCECNRVTSDIVRFTFHGKCHPSRSSGRWKKPPHGRSDQRTLAAGRPGPIVCESSIRKRTIVVQRLEGLW